MEATVQHLQNIIITYMGGHTTPNQHTYFK